MGSDRHQANHGVFLVTFAFVFLLWSQLAHASLNQWFYAETCPELLSIVRYQAEKAVKVEQRMAASLLRLHFHDCFVNGCDASLLLDDTHNFTGEKSAFPNQNSVRGFNVLDDIKSAVESACPDTVSCADILAITARDSVVLSGGPHWDVLLGRRDSTSANRTAANNDIPSPNSNITQLETSFAVVGLSMDDLIVLSGAHTIGRSKCSTINGANSRLYNFSGTCEPDPLLNPLYLFKLQETCPKNGDGNVQLLLDPYTPNTFDSHYYENIIVGDGIFHSDEVLFSIHNLYTSSLVVAYAYDQPLWFERFASSMVKMGNIHPLEGTEGQIRKNCHFVN